MLVHGFGLLSLQQIEANVFPDNEASMRVLTKTGFNKTGTSINPAPARGGDREVVVYHVTRADFARAVLAAAVGRT